MVRLANKGSCHSLLMSTRTHTSRPSQIAFVDERCAERRFEKREKHMRKKKKNLNTTRSEISSYLGLLPRSSKGLGTRLYRAIFTSIPPLVSAQWPHITPTLTSSSYVNVVRKITRVSYFPDFWEIKRMRKQCIPGALSNFRVPGYEASTCHARNFTYQALPL